MKLVIFNGSPRAGKSNSKFFIDSFKKGYSSSSNNECDSFYLYHTNKFDEYVGHFSEADTIIFVFPLYTDAMPGMVKLFFESLENQKVSGKKIGFIVHSGFPESSQSNCIKKYLKRFVEIINCNYIGTVVKGGSESLQFVPDKMKNKTLLDFYNLGYFFGENETFNFEIVTKLGKPYKFNFFILLVIKILNSLRVLDVHWNGILKKNDAFEKRYDRPYLRK